MFPTLRMFCEVIRDYVTKANISLLIICIDDRLMLTKILNSTDCR